MDDEARHRWERFMSHLHMNAQKGRLERGRINLDEWAMKDIDQDVPGVGTPLAGASKKGQILFMELLLARGADIHASNEMALVQAAANDQIEAVKALLSYGATVDLEQHSEAKGAARQLLLDYIANPGIIPQKPLPPEPFTIGKWTTRQKLKEARNPIPLIPEDVGKMRNLDDWKCKATWECRANGAILNSHYDKVCRVCGRRGDTDNEFRTVFPTVGQLHPDIGLKVDDPEWDIPYAKHEYGFPTTVNPDPNLPEYVFLGHWGTSHFEFYEDDEKWLWQHGHYWWYRLKDGHIDRDWMLVPKQGSSSTANPQNAAQDALVDRIIRLLKEQVQAEDAIASESSGPDRVTAWRADSRLVDDFSRARQALAERRNREMRVITSGVESLSVDE